MAREARSSSVIVVMLRPGSGSRSGKSLVLNGNAGLGWNSFRIAMELDAMHGVEVVARVAGISSGLREFLVS